jgi:hypothetical protein
MYRTHTTTVSEATVIIEKRMNKYMLVILIYSAILTGTPRFLTDRIVDRRVPEYHIILRIGSGSHSDFKFAQNDRIGDPLEGHQSDPFWILYYQIGLDDNDLQL